MSSDMLRSLRNFIRCLDVAVARRSRSLRADVILVCDTAAAGRRPKETNSLPTKGVGSISRNLVSPARRSRSVSSAADPVLTSVSSVCSSYAAHLLVYPGVWCSA